MDGRERQVDRGWRRASKDELMTRSADRGRDGRMNDALPLDARDRMSVQWQCNGASPMSMLTNET